MAAGKAKKKIKRGCWSGCHTTDFPQPRLELSAKLAANQKWKVRFQRGKCGMTGN